MLHQRADEFQRPFGPLIADHVDETIHDELRESRRLFESVLQSLSGVFYRCELEAPWKMSFVSDGLTELTGYTQEDLDRLDGWSGIMRVEDRQSVETAVAEAVAKKTGFDCCYRITVKSGRTRWVKERGHAVFDTSGRALYLEGVVTDISDRKRADDEQKSMLDRWKRTLDAIPQMVWSMAGDGSDEYYNAQWGHFTGCRLDGTGLTRAELVHEDDRARVLSLWQEKFVSGEPYEAQYRLKHAQGGYRWILSRGEPEKDAHGKTVRWYGTCTDIHEELLARQALQASEAVNRSMIEASPDGISLLDNQGRIRFINRAGMDALELPGPDPIAGRLWASIFPSSFRALARTEFATAMAGGLGRLTVTQGTEAGQKWWDVVIAPIDGNGDKPDGLISIARDITHQKTTEERIRWAANHDPLTLLPNRALFQNTVDQVLREGRSGGSSSAILMIDLDDFKRTNDALGHDAGDAVLLEFSSRLRASVRSDDTVARLGGDEFAVLLVGLSNQEDVEAAGRSILASLRTPCLFDGKLLDIRASIGASIFPLHGQDRTELFKHADVALLAAKSTRRGGLRVFEPAMRAQAQKQLSMLALARDAIVTNRILSFYQPKVSLRSGRLDGFEALLRWKHPTQGLQNPDTIAAAFTDGILATEISDRMIQSVVADMRWWEDSGIEFGHVALNAAAAEFKNGRFAEKLLKELREANVATCRLQLEVTETVFLGRGAEHVEDTLRALAQEGIQIALDDFGTGFASLSHLNRFPVHVIKIDQSFIDKLETSEHDAAIARAVIKLGRSLGIRIVAEGIERQSQADFLRKHRCHSGQGFLFGKAVHPSEVPGLIANWSQGNSFGAPLKEPVRKPRRLVTRATATGVRS